MGTVSRAAYQPTLVAVSQPNFPDLADRSALLLGNIITDIAAMPESSMGIGTREVPFITPATDNKAAYGSNYGDNFLFERIWVDPLAIDAGFIVEDSQETISVWNSSRFDSVSVTGILAENPDGTQLTYDPLPNVIPIFGDINYLLEIFNVGPPLQDSTYQFTIAGLVYDIDVTGIRVLPFDLDPNWDDGIKLTYSFQSTIFKSKRLNEQRRPLSQDSWFNISFNADARQNRSRINFNRISYGKDKVFGVPVFTEKIEPIGTGQGAVAIYTNEDLTKLYNLNNRANYIILVDHINGMAEVKLVDSIGVGVINLDQPISDDFQQSTTYVYPCMFCYLKSFRSINETDDFTEISIDFEQYKS